MARRPVIVNSSRSALYAANGDPWKGAARNAAWATREALEAARG